MTQVSKAVWGPACWTLLHAAAAACEPQTATAFAAFLWALGHVLPCPECRAHLVAFLHATRPEQIIRDAASASRYTFTLHNHVNEQIGKHLAPPELIHVSYGVKLIGLAVRPLSDGRHRRQMPLLARPFRIP